MPNDQTLSPPSRAHQNADALKLLSAGVGQFYERYSVVFRAFTMGTSDVEIYLRDDQGKNYYSTADLETVQSHANRDDLFFSEGVFSTFSKSIRANGIVISRYPVPPETLNKGSELESVFSITRGDSFSANNTVHIAQDRLIVEDASSATFIVRTMDGTTFHRAGTFEDIDNHAQRGDFYSSRPGYLALCYGKRNNGMKFIPAFTQVTITPQSER